MSMTITEMGLYDSSSMTYHYRHSAPLWNYCKTFDTKKHKFSQPKII